MQGVTPSSNSLYDGVPLEPAPSVRQVRHLGTTSEAFVGSFALQSAGHAKRRRVAGAGNLVWDCHVGHSD